MIAAARALSVARERAGEQLYRLLPVKQAILGESSCSREIALRHRLFLLAVTIGSSSCATRDVQQPLPRPRAAA